MYKIDFDHPISVYFIGIGGISMSGLAEILLSRGFKISGSDRLSSHLTELLEEKGAVIHYGQRAENIDGALEPPLIGARRNVLVLHSSLRIRSSCEWSR